VQFIIILVLLIPILAIVLDSPVGRALAGRLERRSIADGADTTGERLAFLEGEIERLNDEVRQLEEESDFLHRLLEQRPPRDSLPSSSDELE